MSVLLIYLLILLAVFLLQRKMLYFPARFTQEQQEHLMPELNLKPWPSLNNLHGVTSGTPLTVVKGTVLVFHGNAGAALHQAYYIDALQRLGYRVIVAEYPGCGARNGSPSEEVLVEDGIATANMARDEFKGPLFLCGESLGSGVVAGIVASGKVPVKGLLLVTPFDAMVEVAQHHYWYLLARWLILDKYDNVSNLRNFQGRIAVLLAGQDEIIPNRRTLSLFDALPGQKKLWRFEHAGHNGIPMKPESQWWQETMAFIDT
ncbi:alpha/beta hydrolase [Methyloglobulus morosus]|nr:alpha/beta fold hydrolase [Methyloglobulus morosus]